MRFRIDVGIHAQRNRRLSCRSFAATSFSACSSGIDSTLKHFTPASSASRISAARLADARKHRVLRLAARGQHARQFARRHDVEARAEPREHVEHGEIAVRLDGDVDLRATARACIGVGAIGLGQRARE